MVTLEKISFAYGTKPLFEALDLELMPGGIYGLLGANGAGKTTLLKLLAGLRFPQSGSIRVAGEEPSRRQPEFLSDMVFVPEVCPTFNMTLEQFCKNYAPLYPRFDAASYVRHMAEFELFPRQNLTTLSYGQQKKAALAFSLSCGARLILLDEPSNGLDILSKSQLRKVIAGAAQKDRVIVISTHQVRDLENLIDPIVILHEGQIVFNQSMEAVAAHLTCRLFPEDPGSDPDVLFAEQRVGEWVAVCPVREAAAEVTPPDLELLFKAVIHAPRKFASQFGKGMGR